jgi:hypothetical protein
MLQKMERGQWSARSDVALLPWREPSLGKSPMVVVVAVVVVVVVAAAVGQGREGGTATRSLRPLHRAGAAPAGRGAALRGRVASAGAALRTDGERGGGGRRRRAARRLSRSARPRVFISGRRRGR